MMFSLIAMLGLASAPSTTQAIAAPQPEIALITSGDLEVRALVWRPPGAGPFPAVLLNHGSYSTADPMPKSEPELLGPVFARHGYVFMFLFRQGIGLSAGQGAADGDQMDRALAEGGQAARNDIQMQLLQGEELDESRAALAWLKKQPAVDARRIAVVGHSFGGSLSLIQSENDPSIKVLVLFAAASGSWDHSPSLRERMNAALARLGVPIFLLYAQNDYSLASAKDMAAELQRLAKPHELKIYPAIGTSRRDGHNLLYRSVPTWEHDVFRFLDRTFESSHAH